MNKNEIMAQFSLLQKSFLKLLELLEFETPIKELKAGAASEDKVELIQKTVAEKYDIDVKSMRSKFRGAERLSRPRQIAMFISVKLTDLNCTEIGRLFGGREHSTITHAAKRIEEIMSTEPKTAERISSMLSELEAQFNCKIITKA